MGTGRCCCLPHGHHKCVLVATSSSWCWLLDVPVGHITVLAKHCLCLLGREGFSPTGPVAGGDQSPQSFDEATLVDVSSKVGPVWLQGVPGDPPPSLHPVKAVVGVGDFLLLPHNLIRVEAQAASCWDSVVLPACWCWPQEESQPCPNDGGRQDEDVCLIEVGRVLQDCANLLEAIVLDDDSCPFACEKAFQSLREHPVVVQDAVCVEATPFPLCPLVGIMVLGGSAFYRIAQAGSDPINSGGYHRVNPAMPGYPKDFHDQPLSTAVYPMRDDHHRVALGH